MIERQLYAYTDGSTFRSNPGPMSWAVVYVRDNAISLDHEGERVKVGAYQSGTNNRAELMAVIWALEHETNEDLVIRSDSMVTIRCAQRLYQRHANRDLWARFDEAIQFRKRRGLKTSFEHVKGHDIDPFNKLADRLAGDHAKANFECLQEVI